MLKNNFNLVAVVVFFIISYKNKSKVSLRYAHNLIGPMLTSYTTLSAPLSVEADRRRIPRMGYAHNVFAFFSLSGRP